MGLILESNKVLLNANSIRRFVCIHLFTSFDVNKCIQTAVEFLQVMPLHVMPVPRIGVLGPSPSCSTSDSDG